MVRKAFRITLADKSLCYKTLLSRVIVYAVCFTAIYFIGRASVLPILKSEEIATIFKALRLNVFDFFNAQEMVSGTSESVINLRNAYSAFLSLLKERVGGFIWSAVGIACVIQVFKFLLGIIDYTVGVLLNDHMQTLRHAPFFYTLFEHFSESVRYGLYRMIALLAYHTVSFFTVYLISYLLFKAIGAFVIPITIFLIVLVVVIRQTFAGQTLPIMIIEKRSAFSAFKENFIRYRVDQAKERFFSYIVLSIVSFSVSAALMQASLGVAAVVTTPIITVTFSAVKFVDYYTVHSKKFFITYDEIYIPKELRAGGEQLLNKVDL